MEEQEVECLNYRLVGASSEDPDHPIFSLLSPSAPQNNSGWHSIRFCPYPQEILINFPSPVRLREVSLIFHEYLIPTKVEFYYFFPSNYNEFFADPNSLTYKKIGYTEPSNNSKANYSAREFKKIYLNQNCYYLKLVFHKNYQNKYNLFNQIGLVKLNCFGFTFKKNNIDILYPVRDPNVNYFPKDLDQYIPEPDIQESEIDPFILEKINHIKGSLDEAIKEENYDSAKALNEFIQRLKFFAIKINKFTDIKLKAISISDFDTAKRMKLEIDRIKAYIESLNEEELISNAINSNFNFKRQNNFNEIGDEIAQQELEMNLAMNSEDNMKINPNMQEQGGGYEIQNVYDQAYEEIDSNKVLSKSDEIRLNAQRKKQMIKESKEQATKNLREENRRANMNVEGKVKNTEEEYNNTYIYNTDQNKDQIDAVHQQIKVKK